MLSMLDPLCGHGQSLPSQGLLPFSTNVTHSEEKAIIKDLRQHVSNDKNSVNWHFLLPPAISDRERRIHEDIDCY